MDCTKCTHRIVCGIEFKEKCKHFVDETTIAPAYVGQLMYKLYANYGYKNGSKDLKDYGVVAYTVVEAKVSMIQQKADKSWKIRLTYNGSVSDHVVSNIGNYIFYTKEEAEKKAEEKNNGLSRI